MQVRETGAFTGGEGDLIDFKTTLMELDKVGEFMFIAFSAGTIALSVEVNTTTPGEARKQTRIHTHTHTHASYHTYIHTWLTPMKNNALLSHEILFAAVCRV